ncbi:hypothetical protein TPHA_0G01055 [Tetrapisispora phaffii CBS 4417]|uniref:Uncharacterized protein n=1 Tax=Tetrapisispora phaffii (strain ATCC 24235 / CBS 4417 / NBRC 1672 / NRRL Y-8282 / UCD 70-5) TaxID=1071381 RepID=G8BVL4_TETPH|nr:hypothetical protein TPHA_0G01055 [Tetrapisispora phaffii CBS 4417]CCE63942.1 hypothetical protein TPHA_0G01055 [Tetrapisispora phaffii CBS 4417]
MQFSKVIFSGLAVIGVTQAASNATNGSSTNAANVNNALLADKTNVIGAAAVAGIVALLI